MKKIYFTSILLFITLGLIAQKTEYRYGAIKFLLIHNYSIVPASNPSVLFKTPKGDMIKTQGSYLNYVPGLAFSYNYNLDAKNDKWGLVLGLEVQNNGYQSSYKTSNENNNYTATDRYRTTTVGLPVYLKLGDRNIYRNQSYLTIGFEYNYYLYVQNINTANWTSQRFSRLLDGDEKRGSGVAFILGYNYNIYNVQLEYWFSNYVNKKYITQADGINATPFAQVNFSNSIFIKTGINIPMTRWLTAQNWRAEQIRRFFK